MRARSHPPRRAGCRSLRQPAQQMKGDGNQQQVTAEHRQPQAPPHRCNGVGPQGDEGGRLADGLGVEAAPDRPTIRLASDVTPAAIVTTAVARRCGTSWFWAIIPLLLGPHAANLLARPGLAGFTFLRDAPARTSHGAESFGHLVLSNI